MSMDAPIGTFLRKLGLADHIRITEAFQAEEFTCARELNELKVTDKDMLEILGGDRGVVNVIRAALDAEQPTGTESGVASCSSSAQVRFDTAKSTDLTANICVGLEGQLHPLGSSKDDAAGQVLSGGPALRGEQDSPLPETCCVVPNTTASSMCAVIRVDMVGICIVKALPFSVTLTGELVCASSDSIDEKETPAGVRHLKSPLEPAALSMSAGASMVGCTSGKLSTGQQEQKEEADTKQKEETNINANTIVEPWSQLVSECVMQNGRLKRHVRRYTSMATLELQLQLLGEVRVRELLDLSRRTRPLSDAASAQAEVCLQAGLELLETPPNTASSPACQYAKTALNAVRRVLAPRFKTNTKPATSPKSSKALPAMVTSPPQIGDRLMVSFNVRLGGCICAALVD